MKKLENESKSVEELNKIIKKYDMAIFIMSIGIVVCFAIMFFAR